MHKAKRSVERRAFNALCVLGLVCAAFYLLFAGFNWIGTSVVLGAITGMATPVVMSGAGFGEVLAGIFEAILDGIIAIFDGIVSIFSGLGG